MKRTKEEKKERRKEFKARLGRELKGFIPSLLSAAAETGSGGLIPMVLNVGAKIIKKKPIPGLIDPTVIATDDTIVKPGEKNLTKNGFLIIFGMLVLNAVASKYLGLEILPPEFLNGILGALKSIILDSILSNIGL